MTNRIHNLTCLLRVFLVSGVMVLPSRVHAEEPDTPQFWALQPPQASTVPATRRTDWCRGRLDHFVLARLEQAGLEPADDAASEMLLRRVHFDLIGLPPSPEARTAFESRVSAVGLRAALEIEVDQLLADQGFGERWGRHWLDVARYAESSGKETNVTFPHAWRYRDYVIDAVNADKPYDRFLTEQLAGDLLPADNPRQRAQLLTATGFLAIGPKGLNEPNRPQFLADLVDEQIDTVTRSVLAMTVACARCHDHTSDPFTMDDYYGLAGIFASTRTYFGTSIAPGNQQGGDLLRLPRDVGLPVFNQSIPAKQLEKLRTELAELNREEREGRAAALKAALSGGDPEKHFSLRDALRIIWRRGSIEGRLKTVDDTGTAHTLAMGVSEADQIKDVPVLERGELSQAGDSVPRGFPSALTVDTFPPIPSDQSGRLELARWLTHPQNPLTARVLVNRVWHHLLGAGLVRTVDNFGESGERPTHPELLDDLAVRFVDGGWSLKSVVREIVLSRTYAQASDYRADAFQTDPENRLLWRVSKRRLEAEAIRDAMLAVSGQLDRQRPEGSLVARIGNRPVSLIAFDKRVAADLDGAEHRSVYLPVLRDRQPDVLQLFDCAEPSLVSGSRPTTNVPLQALYLMNGEFVIRQSTAFADRLRAFSDRTDRQIVRAFELCFCRAPDADELNWALQFLGESSATDQDPLAVFCQALLATAEFRNLD